VLFGPEDVNAHCDLITLMNHCDCLIHTSSYLVRASIIAGSKPAESYMEESEKEREESGRFTRSWLKQADSSLLVGPDRGKG